MTVPITSGPPVHADIHAYVGAPAQVQVVFRDVDWSGTYAGQVRTAAGATGDPADTLTVAAAYADPDTTVQVTLPADHPLTAGVYYYDVKGASASVIIVGRVFVNARTTI